MRGFVYEAGPGAQAVHDASARWHLPVEVVPAAEDPSALRTAVAGCSSRAAEHRQADVTGLGLLSKPAALLPA